MNRPKVTNILVVIFLFLFVIFLVYVIPNVTNYLVPTPLLSNESPKTLPDINISYNIDEDGLIFVKTPIYSAAIGGKSSKECGLIKELYLSNSNISLITPTYRPKYDIMNSFNYELRADLYSIEHGFLYKKSVHLPFTCRDTTSVEVSKLNSCVVVRYISMGSLIPWEDRNVKNPKIYNGVWTIEYRFYPDYFEYIFSFNLTKDLKVEYIKPIYFHFNLNAVPYWYIEPGYFGKFYEPQKDTNIYFGHFANQPLNFFAVFDNLSALAIYLAETSEPLDYVVLSPHTNPNGIGVVGIYIGFSGQHSISVVDERFGTQNPSKYTLYKGNKTHFWKFKIVPLINHKEDWKLMKQKLDEYFYSLTCNDITLSIMSDDTIDVIVNGIRYGEITNAVVHTNYLNYGYSGVGYINTIKIINENNYTTNVSIVLTRYNKSVYAQHIIVPPKGSYFHLIDLWTLSGKKLNNTWLIIYSNNTENFYNVYINGYHIGNLKKSRNTFKNIFYLDEKILLKSTEIQINCSKYKIKSILIYKYRYDKKIDEIKCQEVKEVRGRTICLLTIR